MITFVIAIHVLICVLLIIIILIQSGRGGGLVENFSGVESMFGTKTSTFLTKSTTILSIAFFVTCLSLALISAKQSRSLMKGIKTQPVDAAATTPGSTQPAVKPETPAQNPVDQTTAKEGANDQKQNSKE
jgi:preprotein translocase subunit SecG